MSSVLVLLAFSSILAPAALALFRSDVGSLTGGFYAALVMVALGYHLGFRVHRQDLAAPQAPASLEKGPCEQALAAGRRGGLVFQSDDPNQLVVRQDMWREMPSTVREALVTCAGAVRGAGSGEAAVEVVERPGRPQQAAPRPEA